MNFHDYLNRQKTEDRRAFVVHYPANSGKTEFALRVCAARPDACRLDLLAHFLEHADLPPIEEFGPAELRELLLGFEVTQSVVLVDNSDFLFNTWSEKEKTRFANWLRRQLRSPGVTEKTFVFLLQSEPFIETMNLEKNSYRESRVQPLNAFEMP